MSGSLILHFSFCNLNCSLAQLIPRQRRRTVALVAAQLLGAGVECLPVAAAGADRIGERKDAADALDQPWLAAHDGPSLGWLLPDLQQAAIDGHVLPVHV